MFIATGKALADAGPASMLLAYFMVCIGIWANLQTLTEMTIAFPTSGNYIDYAGRWVDPALAFGAGFAEWLGNPLIPVCSTKASCTNTTLQDGHPYSLQKLHSVSC